MERLVADAAKIDKSVDANSLSFGNIVAAINVVQKEMGIYGTTALEAEKTISGSLNAMKGAWSNLITGIADDNADFDTLINNMVETVGTFAENIIPRVEIALSGIAGLIEKLAPIIIEKLPSLVDTLVPALISAATGMVNSVIDVLPSLLETIVTALVENAPLLIKAAIGLINSLIQSIQDNSQILIDGAINIVTTLANGILSMLPDIIKLGLDLIVSLALGIADALPELVPTIISVMMQIVDTLTQPDTLSNLLDAALVLILALADGLVQYIPALIDATITLIDRLITFLLEPENIKKLAEASVKIVVALAEGLIKSVGTLMGSVGTLISNIVAKFKENDWKQVGKNIVDGIWNGLKSTWESLKKWFTNAWDNLVGGVKDFLGIHSPSRVFAGIGKNMALGVGEGWEDTFGDVQDDIDSSLDFGEADYGITTSSTSIGDFSGGSSRSGYGGTQNVNVTVGIDNNANAMGLARALLPFLKIAEKEAYA